MFLFVNLILPQEKGMGWEWGLMQHPLKSALLKPACRGFPSCWEKAGERLASRKLAKKMRREESLEMRKIKNDYPIWPRLDWGLHFQARFQAFDGGVSFGLLMFGSTLPLADPMIVGIEIYFYGSFITHCHRIALNDQFGTMLQ